MDYEGFIDEVRRRAGPISREEAVAVSAAYLETLRDVLPGDLPGRLGAHLPEKLAGYLGDDGGGEDLSVWEFHERFARRAGAAPEHATRYARHVGSVVGGAVPEEDLAAARDELPPEYWELAERVLPDPFYYGSFERTSLGPSGLPVSGKAD